MGGPKIKVNTLCPKKLVLNKTVILANTYRGLAILWALFKMLYYSWVQCHPI